MVLADQLATAQCKSRTDNRSPLHSQLRTFSYLAA